VAGYVNVYRANRPEEPGPRVAAQPDVVSILPSFLPAKNWMNGRDQIISGHLNGRDCQTFPPDPGYLAWADQHGGVLAGAVRCLGLLRWMSPDSGIDNGNDRAPITLACTREVM